jgi:hypothetical protein
MNYVNPAPGFARFMQELYLIVAQLIVYRLNFRVDCFPVHGIEADNVRDSKPTDKLAAPRGVIVLPPYVAPPYAQ